MIDIATVLFRAQGRVTWRQEVRMMNVGEVEAIGGGVISTIILVKYVHQFYSISEHQIVLYQSYLFPTIILNV